MSRLSIALALLLLTAAAAQAAADPHAERVRLTPADTALARRTVLQRGDVVADWKAMSIPRIPGGRLPCPDFNPDFSAFTVTGKAATAFSHPTGGSIISTIEVYASRADAVGDFQVGAQPGVAK